MQLGVLQSVITSDYRKYDGSVSKREGTKSDAVAKKSDKASLSSEARSVGALSADIRVLSARVAAEPDIRVDKVEQVREKIENGFYNSEEFAEQLAERLIKDMNF